MEPFWDLKIHRNIDWLTPPCLCQQWNLWQQTPPITEAFTMQTRSRGPESFPIVYCTLRPPYRGNVPTLKYRQPQRSKINNYKFPSENRQSHARVTYWYNRVEKSFVFLDNFSCFYSFYNASQLYLRSKLSYIDWKRSSLYWVHSLYYNGHLPIADI